MTNKEILKKALEIYEALERGDRVRYKAIGQEMELLESNLEIADALWLAKKGYKIESQPKNEILQNILSQKFSVPAESLGKLYIICKRIHNAPKTMFTGHRILNNALHELAKVMDEIEEKKCQNS
jgi:hypothetical protein